MQAQKTLGRSSSSIMTPPNVLPPQLSMCENGDMSRQLIAKGRGMMA